MSFSDTTRKRLSLLLPMLGSDKDGEVVASVRQIARALAAEGKDFHDLTKALSGQPTVVYQTVFRDPPKQEQAARPAGNRWGGGGNEWSAKARFCSQHSDSLSEREAAFVTDMVSKLERWGDPTEKQAQWLDAIHQKLRRQYGETA